MSIFEVRHQARAHRIVQRALSSHRLPHAYIFHGPDGVGKRTLAMHVAKLLLCPQSPTISPPPEVGSVEGIVWKDACGACQDCTLVHGGTHPDLHVVRKELVRYHPAPEVRARKALDLSVDVVRHFIIGQIGDRPARGRFRVFIVLDADQMSVSAQNALLKTLEEPPGSAFIILITRSLDRLLATTLSRCQPVPFGTLPDEFVGEQLRARRSDLSPGQVQFLSRYCSGQLGLALSQAEAGLYDLNLQLGRAVADLPAIGPSEFAAVMQQCAGSLAERYLAQLVEEGVIEKASEASTAEPTRRGLYDCLSLLAWLLRDAMRWGCGQRDGMVNADQTAVVESLSGRLTSEAAACAIREVQHCETEIAANAAVALALEGLAIRIMRLETPSAGGSGRAPQRTGV